jgi:hypothetical protein
LFQVHFECSLYNLVTQIVLLILRLVKYFLGLLGHALVFNRGALGVDNDDFDEKFSLAIASACNGCVG